MGMKSHEPARPVERGFTLVEILIVVIILGILAAIVVPQFTNASTDARTTNLKTTLNAVRNQIEVFKGQHNDLPPQLEGMWAVMLTSTSTTETNVPDPMGTNFGPYLLSAPVNPTNGKTGVSSAAVDTTAGWYYQPAGIGFSFLARSADGSVNTAY